MPQTADGLQFLFGEQRSSTMHNAKFMIEEKQKSLEAHAPEALMKTCCDIGIVR